MRRSAFLASLALIIAACTGGESAAPSVPAASSTPPTTETGSPEPTGPGEPEQTTLRLAYSAGLAFSSGAFFKLEEDLRASGIDVQVDVFDSTQDAFRAMIAGEADMAEGTFAATVSLAQAGGGAKLIAVDQKAPDYLLISQAPVTTLADLEGLRVGISTPGDTSDTLTRLVLRREDVDEDAVEYIQIGGTSARMAGLLADQLDAGLAHAAEGINAVQESDGKLKILWRVGETVPSYLQRGLMVSDEFLAANPNLTQIVVDTLMEGVRWSQDSANEDAYVELACSTVELPEPVCHEAWALYREIGMWALDGGLESDRLAETVAIEVEVGNLEGDIPNESEYVDRSFIESYLVRYGTRE